MAPKIRIRWTPQAADDLEHAYEYLNQHNSPAAAAVIDRILSGIKALKDYPGIGRPGRIEETRELVITGTRFIVFYRLRKQQIQILGILHASRKWPDAL